MMKFNPQWLQAYLVGGTQDVGHDPTQFLKKVELAMAAGITAFQYREKGTSRLNATKRFAIARQLRTLTHQYKIPLFIDDDEELALRVDADGVHVGQRDQRIEQVIVRAGGRLMIGYSCNTSQQIAKANRLPAIDYIGTGPVFPTTSKADADPALGLNQLCQLNHLSVHPVVAIGGITKDNLVATLQTGVAGVAVISMILKSDDLRTTVKKMRAAYNHRN